MDNISQSTKTPNIFRHTHLEGDRIRLFSFVNAGLNDAASDSISIQLTDFPLLTNAKPSFVAISYVCGNLEDLVPIIVNDSILTIYRTLYQALKDLRPTLGTSLVWADAICISQTDQKDKEKQVAAIGDIYRVADGVLLYSGAASESSSLLFEGFPALLTSIANAAASPVDLPRRTLSQGFFEMHQLPFPTDPIWGAYSEFYRRKWMQRLWIVQEISLAKAVTIYCGDKPFQWTDLLDLEEHMRQLELWTAFTKDLVTSVPSWSTISDFELRRNGRFKTLISTLASAGRDQCHNPLDTIYALRCMFPVPVREQIPVSYDSELQTHPYRLYNHVGHVALSAYPDLFVLVMSRTQETLPQLPSWCRNWRSKSECVETLDAYPHAGGTLQPLATPPHIASSIDQRRLYLRGVKISRIATVAQMRYSLVGLGPSRWLQDNIAAENSDWLTECVNILPNGRDPAQQVQLFRALTFGDVPDPRWPDAPIPDLELRKIFSILISYLEYARAWARADPTDASSLFVGISPRQTHELMFGQQYQLHPGALRALDERMSGANDERRVFVVEQGLVGNAHRDVKVGDVVAVFRGCAYPLVLRPGSEIGVFTLVSHAWVSELMEGQVWEGEVDEELFIVE